VISSSNFGIISANGQRKRYRMTINFHKYKRDFSLLLNVQTGSGAIRSPFQWMPGFSEGGKSARA